MKSSLCSFFVVALAMLTVVRAQQPADPAPASPGGPATPPAGQKRKDVAALKYAELCASCHGPNLQGGQAGSLLLPELVHGNDEASLMRSIRDGFPGKAMPAWGPVLSEGDIHALVVYLREIRTGAQRPPTGSDTQIVPQGIQKSELHDYRIEVLLDTGANLLSPWSFCFLPDGSILIADKKSPKISIYRNGTLVPEELKFPPTEALRDVRPHPDYAHNGWLYVLVSDTKEPEDEFLQLLRGHIRAGSLVDVEKLLTIPGSSFTGRLAFDDKGYVYIATGHTDSVKGQFMTYAQDLAKGTGKIHRIHDDGRIPADNPFVHQPGALPSVWTRGHRIPEGLTFDRTTGELWATEHGPRGGDELNLIHGGGNYGWPLITYGMDYNGAPVSNQTAQDGMEQPVTYWTPSIAVSAITFYEGKAFPQWAHSLFVTSLKDQTLFRLVLDGHKVVHTETLLKNAGRLRDITVGPDGYLYILAELIDGAKGTVPKARLIRLVPAE